MIDDGDGEPNVLTAPMRASFVAEELRADFAERVTAAWLKERPPRRRCGAGPRFRWRSAD